MPAIYRVACEACDFEVEEHIPLTLATQLDGSLVVCPHPLERQYAERATGVSWKELVRERRIQTRYALICTRCGEAAHYELPARGLREPFLRAITYQPKPQDAAGLRCSRCEAQALRPLTTSFKGVPCPRCGDPALSSELTGRA